jgi:hypothetical protein
MAFTISDFTDLRQLLVAHPEWRVDLRQLVLTDELLDLPGVVHELAEAQKRTEARVEELAEAQKRTEARVEELVQAQKHTESALERLTHAQERTEEALRLLTERQNKMLGDLLALRYAQRAAAIFGIILRRVRVVLPSPALDAKFEDRLEEALTHDELMQVLWLDVIAFGRLRQPLKDGSNEVCLALEVSAVIDRSDIERAHARAGLLRKAGYRALAVVAGEGLTLGASQLFEDLPVVMVTDGRSSGWEQALAAA